MQPQKPKFSFEFNKPVTSTPVTSTPMQPKIESPVAIINQMGTVARQATGPKGIKQAPPSLQLWRPGFMNESIQNVPINNLPSTFKYVGNGFWRWVPVSLIEVRIETTTSVRSGGGGFFSSFFGDDDDEVETVSYPVTYSIPHWLNQYTESMNWETWAKILEKDPLKNSYLNYMQWDKVNWEQKEVEDTENALKSYKGIDADKLHGRKALKNTVDADYNIKTALDALEDEKDEGDYKEYKDVPNVKHHINKIETSIWDIYGSQYMALESDEKKKVKQEFDAILKEKDINKKIAFFMDERNISKLLFPDQRTRDLADFFMSDETARKQLNDETRRLAQEKLSDLLDSLRKSQTEYNKLIATQENELVKLEKRKKRLLTLKKIAEAKNYANDPATKEIYKQQMSKCLAELANLEKIKQEMQNGINSLKSETLKLNRAENATQLSLNNTVNNAEWIEFAISSPYHHSNVFIKPKKVEPVKFEAEIKALKYDFENENKRLQNEIIVNAKKLQQAETDKALLEKEVETLFGDKEANLQAAKQKVLDDTKKLSETKELIKNYFRYYFWNVFGKNEDDKIKELHSSDEDFLLFLENPNNRVEMRVSKPVDPYLFRRLQQIETFGKELIKINTLDFQKQFPSVSKKIEEMPSLISARASHIKTVTIPKRITPPNKFSKDDNTWFPANFVHVEWKAEETLKEIINKEKELESKITKAELYIKAKGDIRKAIAQKDLIDKELTKKSNEFNKKIKALEDKAKTETEKLQAKSLQDAQKGSVLTPEFLKRGKQIKELEKKQRLMIKRTTLEQTLSAEKEQLAKATKLTDDTRKSIVEWIAKIKNKEHKDRFSNQVKNLIQNADLKNHDDVLITVDALNILKNDVLKQKAVENKEETIEVKRKLLLDSSSPEERKKLEEEIKELEVQKNKIAKSTNLETNLIKGDWEGALNENELKTLNTEKEKQESVLESLEVVNTKLKQRQELLKRNINEATSREQEQLEEIRQNILEDWEVAKQDSINKFNVVKFKEDFKETIEEEGITDQDINVLFKQPAHAFDIVEILPDFSKAVKLIIDNIKTKIQNNEISLNPKIKTPSGEEFLVSDFFENLLDNFVDFEQYYQAKETLNQDVIKKFLNKINEEKTKISFLKKWKEKGTSTSEWFEDFYEDFSEFFDVQTIEECEKIKDIHDICSSNNPLYVLTKINYLKQKEKLQTIKKFLLLPELQKDVYFKKAYQDIEKSLKDSLEIQLKKNNQHENYYQKFDSLEKIFNSKNQELVEQANIVQKNIFNQFISFAKRLKFQELKNQQKKELLKLEAQYKDSNNEAYVAKIQEAKNKLLDIEKNIKDQKLNISNLSNSLSSDMSLSRSNLNSSIRNQSQDKTLSKSFGLDKIEEENEEEEKKSLFDEFDFLHKNNDHNKSLELNTAKDFLYNFLKDGVEKTKEDLLKELPQLYIDEIRQPYSDKNKNPSWGGDLEIGVIKDIFDVDVVIQKLDDKGNLIFSTSPSPDKKDFFMLNLQGNHYDYLSKNGKIVKVAPNGDCLFSAAINGLRELKKIDNDYDVKKLRAAIAENLTTKPNEINVLISPFLEMENLKDFEENENSLPLGLCRNLLKDFVRKQEIIKTNKEKKQDFELPASKFIKNYKEYKEKSIQKTQSFLNQKTSQPKVNNSSKDIAPVPTASPLPSKSEQKPTVVNPKYIEIKVKKEPIMKDAAKYIAEIQNMRKKLAELPDEDFFDWDTHNIDKPILTSIDVTGNKMMGFVVDKLPPEIQKEVLELRVLAKGYQEKANNGTITDDEKNKLNDIGKRIRVISDTYMQPTYITTSVPNKYYSQEVQAIKKMALDRIAYFGMNLLQDALDGGISAKDEEVREMFKGLSQEDLQKIKTIYGVQNNPLKSKIEEVESAINQRIMEAHEEQSRRVSNDLARRGYTVESTPYKDTMNSMYASQARDFRDAKANILETSEKIKDSEFKRNFAALVQAEDRVIDPYVVKEESKNVEKELAKKQTTASEQESRARQYQHFASGRLLNAEAQDKEADLLPDDPIEAKNKEMQARFRLNK